VYKSGIRKEIDPEHYLFQTEASSLTVIE